MITLLLFFLKAWAISLAATALFGAYRYWIVTRAEKRDSDHKSHKWLRK